jgi:hypothetical protein
MNHPEGISEFAYIFASGRISVEIKHGQTPMARAYVLEQTTERDFMTNEPVLRVTNAHRYALYPFVDVEAFVDFCTGTLMTSDCVEAMTVETANTIVRKLFSVAGVACGGLVKAPFGGA